MVSQAFGIVNILVFYKSKGNRDFYVQRRLHQPLFMRLEKDWFLQSIDLMCLNEILQRCCFHKFALPLTDTLAVSDGPKNQTDVDFT